MSIAARLEAGFLLRELQRGRTLSMPVSRPMPAIGPRCHELRISGGPVDWRVFYRTDPEVILILDVVRKQTRSTPKAIINQCRRRLAEYDKFNSRRTT
ncbi:MAG TPA: type II toxin-antitoxin system RelE/ParE family toxin [Thermoanaerobaculia bacterium]